jgi:hypothetical protein
MSVSVSGIARFLVRMGAAESIARSIMAEVRPVIMMGQMVDFEDAVQAMSIYAGTFRRWIESEASLPGRMNMARDLVSGNNCVVHVATLVVFLREQGTRDNRAMRIIRRSLYYESRGVITAPDFALFIPPDLMGAWRTFLRLPEDTEDSTYTEPLVIDDYTALSGGFDH